VIGVLFSCTRMIGAIRYYRFLVACFDRVFRSVVGVTVWEAVVGSWSGASGSGLLSGGQLLSRMLPCQLRI